MSSTRSSRSCPTAPRAACDVTNRQDWEVCGLAQLGMGSRAYAEGGLYVTNELHIAAFRDLVLEKLNGPS